MLQDWLILNYSLETATQRNGLCFISSTATRHSVAMLQYLGGTLLKENPASLSASPWLGVPAGGWVHQAEWVVFLQMLLGPEEGEDTPHSSASPSPSHSCDDSFTLHSHWGRERGAEPCADAFHIPLCLNSHFLQKNWARLAFKCASGEMKRKVGFARWNFTTAILRNAGKSFERECGR